MSPNRTIAWCLALLITAATFVHDRPPGARGGGGPYPSDRFGMQRAFPFEAIPQGRFREAATQARLERQATSLDAGGTLFWTPAGPDNIGGRVTALAAVPGGATAYLGAANGGVFKSTNSGVNWTPIFDDLGVYSIGALALDPTDPGVLYVGTGEANASVDSYDGAGIYRTPDGGLSWEFLGLAATARIARIAVDPLNPDRLFVAAMGTQFSTGPDRGLYRSENGGASWTQVLFVNDSTGVCDVIVHPTDPDTVYCATWERIRRPTYRRAYGPGCGIWRSADGGTTWTRLQTGLPAPSDSVGRIGLAIARSQPATIYAQITTGTNLQYRGHGMYRSIDGGQSWARRDLGSTFTGNFGGFSWYFGDMAVDPLNPNRLFALGVGLLRSEDGGISWVSSLGSAHVDQHAMWIDPSNPSRIYLGNDGGFYWSTNGGSIWNKSVDLPITQFYAGAIDPSNPSRLLGGTQDNFTLLTPGGAGAWASILGGDGFYCLVDPTNPSIVFAEWQNCCDKTGPRRSTNGGLSFAAPSGFSGADRYNWSTPFVMDPSNHNVLLAGSQRVYKSTNNGIGYAPISGDLTTNPGAPLVYGTITTLDISAPDAQLYYAGTDDGKVWRSINGGAGWTDISAGLPVRWVTRVTADPTDPDVVYVTLSGFSLDEELSHVYRSADRGDTWTSISGNLPDVPANDILVDPEAPNILYLATDVGVYATYDRGLAWFPLGAGMPIQTIFDLTFHAPSRTLVAATHGRSQWRLDLSKLPLAVDDPAAAPRLQLAPPTPNPSHGAIQLALEVSRATRVEVTAYDAAGRRVRGLLDAALEPGRHRVLWDGRDDRGRPAAAGVYFVRAAGAGAVATRRVVRAH